MIEKRRTDTTQTMQVPTSVIKDKHLSLTSKGLFVYLWSLRKDSKVVYSTIYKNLGITQRIFYKSLTELIQLGYIEEHKNMSRIKKIVLLSEKGIATISLKKEPKVTQKKKANLMHSVPDGLMRSVPDEVSKSIDNENNLIRSVPDSDAQRTRRDTISTYPQRKYTVAYAPSIQKINPINNILIYTKELNKYNIYPDLVNNIISQYKKENKLFRLEIHLAQHKAQPIDKKRPEVLLQNLRADSIDETFLRQWNFDLVKDAHPQFHYFCQKTGHVHKDILRMFALTTDFVVEAIEAVYKLKKSPEGKFILKDDKRRRNRMLKCLRMINGITSYASYEHLEKAIVFVKANPLASKHCNSFVKHKRWNPKKVYRVKELISYLESLD